MKLGKKGEYAEDSGEGQGKEGTRVIEVGDGVATWEVDGCREKQKCEPDSPCLSDPNDYPCVMLPSCLCLLFSYPSRILIT